MGDMNIHITWLTHVRTGPQKNRSRATARPRMLVAGAGNTIFRRVKYSFYYCELGEAWFSNGRRLRRRPFCTEALAILQHPPETCITAPPQKPKAGQVFCTKLTMQENNNGL